MRGEDSSGDRLTALEEETPPRAWGRHRHGLEDCRRERNTPTCVGKTVVACRGLDIHRKHPHVRGEDNRIMNDLGVTRETPPRAWGRQPALDEDAAKRRNTPTCVGKTPTSAGRRCRCRKHPHVRGEDGLEHAIDCFVEETPPRAWGRHQQVVALELLGRSPLWIFLL